MRRAASLPWTSEGSDRAHYLPPFRDHREGDTILGEHFPRSAKDVDRQGVCAGVRSVIRNIFAGPGMYENKTAPRSQNE
jgi:hypothetical protein